jgi:hypothetical protein
LTALAIIAAVLADRQIAVKSCPVEWPGHAGNGLCAHLLAPGAPSGLDEPVAGD